MFTNFIQVAQAKGMALVFAADANSTFAEVMQILQRGLIGAGSLTVAFGLVYLGISIKDSNGPGLQNAILTIVGGLMIAAAGALVATVTI